jgi:hypothetical protein
LPFSHNPRGISQGIAHAESDGKTLSDGQARITLVDDGKTDSVRLVLGHGSA